MNADYFRTMFGYTAWAWARVLDQMEQVSQDEYAATRLRDYPSIRATAVHALAAEMRYLSVWKGEAPGTRPDEATVPTVADLRTAWAEHRKALEAFLADLTDEDCQRDITQLSPRLGQITTPLWQLMTQAVTHHLQHRAEIALQVTQLGHSPGDLDAMLYFRQPRG